MKTRLCAAAAAMVLALALAPAWSADAPSNAVIMPLSQALLAYKNKDYAGALAKLKLAQGVRNRTPFDNFSIYQLMSNIALDQQDIALTATAYEGMADSGAVPQDEKKKILGDAMLLANNRMHYDKTIVYGMQLEAMGAADAAVYRLWSLAQSGRGDYDEAEVYAQKAILYSTSRGQTPDKESIDALKTAQDGKAKDDADLDSFYWGNKVADVIRTQDLKGTDILHLLRLRYVVGAMDGKGALDFAAYLRTHDFSGEARTVISSTIDRGDLTLLDAAVPLMEAGREASAVEKGLPLVTTMTSAGNNGRANAKLAAVLYGFGRYADAEGAAKRAIAMGGVEDPTEVALVLGEILLAEKKFDDAAAAFAKVAGTASRRAIAKLWSDYAEDRKDNAQGAGTP